MHAEPHPATPTIAAGFGVILRALAALIARRFLHHPLHAVLTIPLWQHLTRATLRLDRLFARLAAGPLPPPRLRAHNHSGPHHKPAFPTTRGWLIRALGAEAAACAAQLESLLADPACADLLACTAVRRALAPVRHMLGLVPARRRRPAVATPKPAALALPPAGPGPAPPHHRPGARAPAPPLVAAAAPAAHRLTRSPPPPAPAHRPAPGAICARGSGAGRRFCPTKPQRGHLNSRRGTDMTKTILNLFVSLCLVFALTGAARAMPAHPVGPVHVTDTAVVPVAEGALGGLEEVFKMEPPRLLFLGVGIVTGAVVVAPQLGISELFGVVLGIVGAEFLYRTTYKSSSWFNF